MLSSVSVILKYKIESKEYWRPQWSISNPSSLKSSPVHSSIYNFRLNDCDIPHAFNKSNAQVYCPDFDSKGQWKVKLEVPRNWTGMCNISKPNSSKANQFPSKIKLLKSVTRSDHNHFALHNYLLFDYLLESQCFPRLSSRETLGFSGNKIKKFPSGTVIKYLLYHYREDVASFSVAGISAMPPLGLHSYESW